MPTLAIHADDVAELKQLFAALPEAIQRAGKFLGASGSGHDNNYLAADARVEQVLARIVLLMNGER